MIDLQRYEKLLEEGLILDHYFLLCSLRDGTEVPNSKRIKGLMNVLTKKGYILEGILTEKGMDIISSDVTSTSTTTTRQDVIDFNKWVIDLYNKCQTRIKELTGMKQVRSKVKGTQKSYPFMPNVTDLGKVLVRVINSYKLKDMDLIEKAIMGHIQRCSDEKDWFPLIKYYIMKDGQSQMITDMESGDEERTIVKNNQKFV